MTKRWSSGETLHDAQGWGGGGGGGRMAKVSGRMIRTLQEVQSMRPINAGIRCTVQQLLPPQLLQNFEDISRHPPTPSHMHMSMDPSSLSEDHGLGH